MYSGEAVETRLDIETVFNEMQHPYTQALFRSIPLPGADKNSRPLVAIPGNFPLPHERPPKGCNFGPRCDYFEEPGAATRNSFRCPPAGDGNEGPRDALPEVPGNRLERADHRRRTKRKSRTRARLS